MGVGDRTKELQLLEHGSSLLLPRNHHSLPTLVLTSSLYKNGDEN